MQSGCIYVFQFTSGVAGRGGREGGQGEEERGVEREINEEGERARGENGEKGWG